MGDQFATYNTKSSDSSSTLSDNALAASITRCSASVDNLPDSLKIRVPTSTPFGLHVSDEFVSVIHGLLDVRIPQRLGAGEQNYKALKEHPFFDIIGASWESVMRREADSPLGIDIALARDNILFAHAQKSRIYDSRDCNEKVNFHDIPTVVQETLREYSFTSAQFSVLPNKHKHPSDFSVSRTFTSVAAEEMLPE